MSGVFWRGPSAFTGEEVVAAMTLEPSRNRKTGDMVQTYVVPARLHAGLAMGTPAEHAVCGACPLAGRLRDRICYVKWGAWSVGREVAQGRALDIGLEGAASHVRGKMVRIGAYGDPAAVPLHVWSTLLNNASGWTGFTHAWRTCSPVFAAFCMASVETEHDAWIARKAGWRTFRIRWPGGAVMSWEVVCAAEARGAHCVDCGMCCGNAVGGKRSVVITAHGRGAARFVGRYQQLRLLGT